MYVASDYKKLQAHWYQKLYDKGFRDIEETRAGEVVLKQQSSNVYRGAHPVIREAKLDYYLQVSAYIHETKFKNIVEKFILLQYAEGTSQKEIEMMLIRRHQRRHLDTIHNTIHRYLKRWGMK